MKHWQQYSLQERIQILDITSGNTGLPRIAVEKDWWVTMVLKALSMTQYSHLMSFKGGTSLSKGWQLINRFSEDIDIALKREDRFAISGTSNTQLTKAKRIARHYIIRELPLLYIICRLLRHKYIQNSQFGETKFSILTKYGCYASFYP